MRAVDLIIIGCWVVLLFYWVAKAPKSKRNSHKDLRRIIMREAFIRIIILLMVLLVLSTHKISTNDITHNVFREILGVAICISGIASAIWARHYLGKNWGMPMTHKQEPELVTTGPYRYVRHPIYSGMLLALLGTAIASSYAWILVMVMVAIYFMYSALIEEKNMITIFPETYADYKNKTKMLIPFLV
jgi:protein-S-isoprenylcysteine O-methyltransferase Ste14